ncbi:ABC transporter permease [Streptomyces sp. QL37]|uniref:ABC transporter permease n=1 Tax=Streptomyces sp. QL37 TaxID=2093747 RepID=UPI000CF2FD84|nr:ABC transporter permease [Streptomyces sp. QL37]PPQ61167.1 ABC transporter permease [Streptomyces sp. QL37]
MKGGTSWWRGVYLVMEGSAPRYRGNWRICLVSGFVHPTLLLLALGLGVGGLVDGGPQERRVGDGLPYLEYLAPAILVVGAVQTAVGEAIHPIMTGLNGERTYYATVSTPITPSQLAVGHVLWVAARIAVTTVCTCVAVLVLTDVPVAPAVGAAVVALLCGTAFATALSALAVVTADGTGLITLVTRVMILPMVLLSGAFFPFALLPVWLHPVAWALPLWHGVELARGADGALPHLGYLLAFLTAGTALTLTRFRRRLTA